jgi:hypothetical protein
MDEKDKEMLKIQFQLVLDLLGMDGLHVLNIKQFFNLKIL